VTILDNRKKQYFKDIKNPLELKNIEDNEERYKDFNPTIDDEIVNPKKHITLGNIR
jgi:hypothetical protein